MHTQTLFLHSQLACESVYVVIAAPALSPSSTCLPDTSNLTNTVVTQIYEAWIHDTRHTTEPTLRPETGLYDRIRPCQQQRHRRRKTDETIGGYKLVVSRHVVEAFLLHHCFVLNSIWSTRRNTAKIGSQPADRCHRPRVAVDAAPRGTFMVRRCTTPLVRARPPDEVTLAAKMKAELSCRRTQVEGAALVTLRGVCDGGPRWVCFRCPRSRLFAFFSFALEAAPWG